MVHPTRADPREVTRPVRGPADFTGFPLVFFFCFMSMFLYEWPTLQFMLPSHFVLVDNRPYSIQLDS